MTGRDAVLAFVAAFAVAAVLTPLSASFARRVGAVDQGPARGLGRAATPRLGGLAIVAAVLLVAAALLDFSGVTEDRMRGILAGAALIAVVGALDDRFDLPPGLKLAGQIAGGDDPGRGRRRGHELHAAVRRRGRPRVGGRRRSRWPGSCWS